MIKEERKVTHRVNKNALLFLCFCIYIKIDIALKDNSKKQTHQNIPQKEPMKFSIVTYPKHINEGKPFYQENKRGNIVYSNNNVFTEIQERIIDKVIKKSKNNK